MTVDVNVTRTDEEMLDDLDEIMEDTMVQLFVLQPRDAEALERAKEAAEEHGALFYCAPLSLMEEADGNCVACYLDDPEALGELPEGKPLFVDASALDDSLVETLIENNCRGIILGADDTFDALETFYVAVGPGNVGNFDTERLARLPMDRIVLQSGYPDFGFDAIYTTAKRISDAMFRPEQSIIARATQSSLRLFGFKK